MSPTQQVWTACWAGLIHSGWDSLRCAWYLYYWVKNTSASRGYVFVAKELKGLAHFVRSASMCSEFKGELPSIRKDVLKAFFNLATKRPTDGFAFSRLSRALPIPNRRDIEEACQKSIIMSKEDYPTSDEVRKSIRSFIISDGKRSMRIPYLLPSSSSSCFEWPATRGGIDGYLFAIGSSCESGFSDYPAITQIVERRLTRDDLKGYAQDSLGRFALQGGRVILDPRGGWSVADIREAYRCVGFLALRRYRAINGSVPTSRMEGIPSPGMKVRVVGVPDALTFMEGDWIRRSCPLLPKEHWIPIGGPDGQPHELTSRGGTFASVDLTAATDGLSHDSVRVVVEALAEIGRIRPADLTMALRGLGLEPRTLWHFGNATWLAKRGSPMGTPLSFVVLSWINAWATSAFTRSRIHGDDAVGVFYQPYEVDEYNSAISSVGASLNVKKTFISPSAWTMCEVFSAPRKGTKFGRAVFIPPPCPPPGLRAPVAAETRCGNRYLRRQERVMRTLFPWCSRDARLRLPTEVGGLGYTGRGLAVPRSVRQRLGTLVSRGIDWTTARNLAGKKPFKEVGLYPRPLIPQPSRPRSFNAARRLVAQDPLEDPSGVEVPLKELIIFESMLVESQYRLIEGDKFKRSRDTGRPERIKTKSLFRDLKNVKLATPLTVSHGLTALRKWALTLESVRVKVFEDVAFEILGRTPNPAQT